MDQFEISKPNEDFQTEYEQTSHEEAVEKYTPAELEQEKDIDSQPVSQETHIPNLMDSDEQFGEHNDIPFEESHLVQNRASPKVSEDFDFDFEKKLPEIPHGNQGNESESPMKFSATHFQDDEPHEDQHFHSHESDIKKEEFFHHDVEEDDEEEQEQEVKEAEQEVKKVAQEESHFKVEEEYPVETHHPKKEESPLSSFNAPPSPSPVVVEEPKKDVDNFYSPPPPAPVEKLINTSPISQPESQPLKPQNETVANVVEPPKTRSVKSTKFEAVGRTFLVVDLVYWRDPKKSGIVLGAVLVILLSLSVVSVVSVVSYSALAVLSGTLSFRLYKNVLQAVQKTQDGHPFKEYLEKDVTVTTEKVHEVADLTAAKLNAALLELRRLFLVEDLVDSVKFALALWALTYVGSWFNGLTLVILGVIGLFSLPKVYETHQEKIDQNLDLVRGKINEIVDKVQAVLPIGKKAKSQ